MSGRKSRAKGAGFENQIARALTDRIGVKFRRTPQSGGWAQGMEDVAGDIVCCEPDEFEIITGHKFDWCVECKKAEGWRLETIFSDKCTWLVSWWTQAVDECPIAHRPILVFSRNRVPIFVAAKQSFFGWTEDVVHINVEVGQHWLTIVTFDIFLDLVAV